MTGICYVVIQVLFFLAAAPLVSGIIAGIKNNLRMRRGQGITQPYYNLAKLWVKSETVPETASWIFRAAPCVVLASSAAAALLVPACLRSAPAGFAGDFLALIFVLALGRFFLGLAGLDAGSSFGGMGSSREMFISSLAEPVVCMVIFTYFLQSGSTAFALRAYPVSAASLISAAALLLVIMAETSRVPVDNRETHLELTMVHEAMLLEYSGRGLALMELSSHIRQMVWFLVAAQLLFPPVLTGGPGCAQAVAGLGWSVGTVVLIAVAVAVLEVSVAKMRLFRVPDYLGFAFVLGVIAVVCAVTGV